MKPAIVDTERAARLKAFVEAMHDKPVEWGVDDCSMWPAQWISDETGKELDLPFYDSEDGARKVIEGAGSLVNVWNRILTPAGIYERPGDPVLGDAGVVDTSDFGPVGGLFAFGLSFLWRHERGVMVLPARRHTILKAWRI